MPDDRPSKQTIRVFYDGACPLCAREIGFYRRREGAAAIDWVDANHVPGDGLPAGLSRDAALRRFHVQASNGDLVSGGAAFAALWTALPGFRWIGALFGGKMLQRPLEGGYRMFLRLRPMLQRLLGHRHREANR